MFNFKKIASVLTSAVMLSSTIGFAAAASYPEPFVTGGLADAAVVYGANAAISDVTAAINVQQKLGALATSGSATTGASVTGEAVPLFTGGTKLYINDNLNTIKNIITETDLPTALDTTSFSGNVDATATQTVEIGSSPVLVFKKQPTGSDDPILGFNLTTSAQNGAAFNLTVTFSKAINFSHADSEGETLSLFGTSYTVSSSTDNTNLVLLKSAEKISLDSDNPSADVTVSGSTYTVELVSSSDTAATIKVTDSSGTSESKEISEAASKKVNGVTVAVTNADETNIKLSASVVVGSEKITFTDNSQVKSGEDDTAIDGTDVDFHGGTPGALTKMTISVTADDSDEDAIIAGQSLTDPVFGTIKLDLAGFNIDFNSDSELQDSAREEIVVQNNGDDSLEVKFTNKKDSKEKTIQYAKFGSGVSNTTLIVNDEYKNMSVRESEILREGDYVMVGNEDEGHLLKVQNLQNSTAGGDATAFAATNYKADFTDVFSGEPLTTTFTTHGSGTLTVEGKSYTVTLQGGSGIDDTLYNVTLNYPDSSGNDVIAYPTIQTSKGAKLAFYEPLVIDPTNWKNGIGGNTSNMSGLMLPNGADGYQTVTVSAVNATGSFNVTCASTTTVLSTTVSSAECNLTNTGFSYNLSWLAGADLGVKLKVANGISEIANPAIMIFEEKDDNSVYEGLIVVPTVASSNTAGAGVSDVERTWQDDNTAWETSRHSDSKKKDEIDLWGTVVTTDTSASAHTTATISYPDEQVYAQVYVAQEAAAITPGTTGGAGGGQVMIVKDSEVSSVASKNLFVVGGSCINTVAAKILGSDKPLCTSDFTDKTGVGAGQFILKTVTSPYSDDKIAMLVAGYEAADTENAVDKALEGVSTDAGTEQVYPIASTTE